MSWNKRCSVKASAISANLDVDCGGQMHDSVKDGLKGMLAAFGDDNVVLETEGHVSPQPAAAPGFDQVRISIRSFKAVAVVLALLLAIVAPARAGGSMPVAGEQDLLVEASVSKALATSQPDASLSPSPGHTTIQVAAGWVYRPTPTQKVGALAQVAKYGAGGGAAAGPLYEWDFYQTRRGAFFVGGDLALTTGAIADANRLLAQYRGGFEWYAAGKVRPRAEVEYDQGLAAGGGGAAPGTGLDQVAAKFGISWGGVGTPPPPPAPAPVTRP